MKKKLKGSYTIEAAFVMAIVLWSVTAGLMAAYKLRDETVGALGLSQALEAGCHSESEEVEELAVREQQYVRPYTYEEYRFSLKRSGNMLTGWRIEANGPGGGTTLKMEKGVFDPENFLRKLSLLDQKEQ